MKNLLASCGVIAVLASLAVLLSAPAQANDAQQCGTIRLGDQGWIESRIANAAAKLALEPLGYTVETVVSQFGEIVRSLQTGQIHAYLNFWPGLMPLPEAHADTAALGRAGPLVEGVELGIAVTPAIASSGLDDVSKLAAFGSDLRWSILGLERGNVINRVIEFMIDDPELGLAGFAVTPSSGDDRLEIVKRLTESNEQLALFAVDPSPLASELSMVFLDGTDPWFNPGEINRDIVKLVSPDFQQHCANAARLIANIKFPKEAMSQISLRLLEGSPPQSTVLEWLLNDPSILEGWLVGVSTADGRAIEFSQFIDSLKSTNSRK